MFDLNYHSINMIKRSQYNLDVFQNWLQQTGLKV